MSINSQAFHQLLSKQGVDFFVGVPDSTLKDFCGYITDHLPPNQHIIVANEGGAIALASGYHLATQKIPVVYMQNSGLGNAVNPLISLADPLVYSIPMILLIGWRGEPGVKDEPQHVKQGLITLPMLDALQIPYAVLDNNMSNIENSIQQAIIYTRDKNAPYALVVRKNLFEKYVSTKIPTVQLLLQREQAIGIIGDTLNPMDIVVSTTGVTSRELFEYREARNQGHEQDFLTVGSMGHASQIALGIALNKSTRQVYCLDGDGAAIMHLGSMAIIGAQKPINFKHILFNNGVHESVGNQPTVGMQIDFQGIARSCGYKTVLMADNEVSLRAQIISLQEATGPAFLEIRVAPGHRSDLGRPTTSPQENKQFLSNFLIQ
ncbi:phosphonopyruvate decarboxylase [Patescibacteria group bacterium]|nr:phosphonopyruvate decarboxylase [Patescibacteria group bacterium]